MNNNIQSGLFANERSEGSNLITYMNKLFEKKDWCFKSAVGELSLRNKKKRGDTLFPDIMLFKDEAQLCPIMGWELKMPDVPIDDKELYNNARDKANMLGADSFVLWNFQNCWVFYKGKNGKWPISPSKEYDQFSNILIDRESVADNHEVWQEKARNVLSDLNDDLREGKFHVAPINFNIKNYVSTISKKLTKRSAEYLLEQKDPDLNSRMRNFANEEHAELADTSFSKRSIKSKNINASLQYAKNIIIHWINRILFCNLIRKDYNSLSEALQYFIKSKNIDSLASDLNEISKITDFYSIIHVEEDEKILPNQVVENLSEFCSYLWGSEFQKANKEFLSKVLESMVSETKRELMGLYTTPPNLAKLLVRLTIRSSKGNIADFTVGSGTIIKEVIKELKDDYQYKIEEIHDKVWASDKYKFPLQVANLNMTTSDSLNLKNIIFQKNALEIEVGEKIEITNPSNGKTETLSLPRMTNIVSNLPFISSNRRSEDDKRAIKTKKSNGKLDIYQEIILHYKSILEESEDARIGVITSNSWFKNRKRTSFFEDLIKNFSVMAVIYSDVAKWFDNSKVVATILILAPKSNKISNVELISLNTDIRKISMNEIDTLCDQINSEQPNEKYSIFDYSYFDVKAFLNTGLCLEALFDDLTWYNIVLQKKDVLAPLTNFCKIIRGTRTGADKIFITKEKVTDPDDSCPFVKTMKNVSSYVIESSDYYLLYTLLMKNELNSKGHKKTYEYIESKKLTDDAKRMKIKHGNMWYIPEDKPKYADFVTSLNPDKRLFWATFEVDTAVNQRIVGAKLNSNYKEDKTLIHALLNSAIPLFILCGSGFARAEGVTDITKDGIEKLYVLNPDLLNKESRDSICRKWEKLRKQNVKDIGVQLKDPEWEDFNKTILKGYGLDEDMYDNIANSIMLLINRRQRISKS